MSVNRVVEYVDIGREADDGLRAVKHTRGYHSRMTWRMAASETLRVNRDVGVVFVAQRGKG